MSRESPNSDAKSPNRNAFAVVLAKLGRRDHTEKELAKVEGLVNDTRLANRMARMTAKTGKRGPRRVIATLRQKGIDAQTAQAATKDAFAVSDEVETSLVRFATRLLERARGETLKARRVKVLRSLVSRGFELSEARRAVRLAENAWMTENRAHDADADDEAGPDE